MEFLIYFPVSCIKTAIAYHFVMLFRDMLDEALNEFHNRNGFFYVFAIFVAVIVEGDKISIIFIDPRSDDYRTTKITTDIFNDGFRITFVGLCIDVETVLMFPVTASLDTFERGSNSVFHIIKESSAEGITKERIVKIIDTAPEAMITVSTFRNEAVDVGIPFQISAKGMKDHDKTWSKIHGLILFEKHAGNNTVDSVEETVEQCPVIKKEEAEIFVNGKDTMAVGNVYQFEGH